MNLYSHTASLPASHRATYSASADVRVTIGCSFGFHEIIRSRSGSVVIRVVVTTAVRVNFEFFSFLDDWFKHQ